ncbi:MAG: sugar phosphate nucleotidyltransferase [bacterium]
MIKKAVLTGGGRATRLRPITSTINKHLIPLAGKPMIFHALEKVAKAGITEVFINTNPGESELQKVVGNGSRWNITIEFFEQIGGPQGIANVVKQAERFIKDDPFIFYLSDNIIAGEIDSLVTDFEHAKNDCMLTLAKVPDPERFGVPYFDVIGNLIDAKEKPADPPNNFAITGIYLFGPKLFFEAYKHIKKSERGEYEIPDIYSYLLKKGYSVGYKEITGWWKDTGKPDDLIKANAMLMDNMPVDFFDEQDKKAGENNNFKNVIIKKPAIIGDNCELIDCSIGPHCTIGDRCKIVNAKISNSIIFDNSCIECDCELNNSIIGRFTVVCGGPCNKPHSLIVGDNALVEL